MGLPTPDEVWNELLLELKAASQELYVAFLSLSASPQGNEPTTARPETQRYDEALRRFDAARAKVRALEAGAVGFLDKPFSDENLITCLNKALAATERHSS